MIKDPKEKNDSESELIPDVEGDDSLPDNTVAQKKMKQLRDELKQCQKEKQEYLTMSQRLRADYLNLRREMEEAQSRIAKFASEPLLLELIELADNFELAFANKEAWEKVDASWRSGVEYIYVKLGTMMQKHGLVEIEALKEVFNPEEHQAIEMVKTDDAARSNRVMEVVRKGYTLHGRVVRPAQVRVYS